MQNIVGGKIVYLYCEEKEALLDFYSQNGFVNFGTRSLDRDETDKLSGEALVQMLKYLDFKKNQTTFAGISVKTRTAAKTAAVPCIHLFFLFCK